MKIKILTIALILTAVLTVYAVNEILESLKATSNGSNINIEWVSKDENNVKSYTVERAGTNMIYEEITTIDAKGYPTTYQYVDESAFKTTDKDKTISQTKFYYRIVINNKDNTKTYSDYTTVTHKTSSIKRTWGMLKEMFR